MSLEEQAASKLRDHVQRRINESFAGITFGKSLCDLCQNAEVRTAYGFRSFILRVCEECACDAQQHVLAYRDWTWCADLKAQQKFTATG